MIHCMGRSRLGEMLRRSRWRSGIYKGGKGRILRVLHAGEGEGMGYACVSQNGVKKHKGRESRTRQLWNPSRGG